MQNLDTESIGKAIRNTREEAKLTQAQLGAAAWMSRSVISRIESGQRDIAWEEIRQLFYALGKKIQIFIEERDVNDQD